jgi:catechol 2,3-dioxygenase-like lactoylglutathione lyase family enzyme
MTDATTLVKDQAADFFRPRRLGHANLFVSDYVEAQKFYYSVAGIHEAYRQPDNMASFMANMKSSKITRRQGQQIEVPMLETMAQFVLADHMGGGAFSPPIGPMGYKRLLSRTRGPYPTRDGYLAIVVYTDKHWRAFLQLVGKPGVMDTDPRFRNQESRT